jgi:hypothetical protein
MSTKTTVMEDPAPVEQQRIPSWLRKRLLDFNRERVKLRKGTFGSSYNKYKGLTPTTTAFYILQEYDTGLGTWLDHWGSSVIDGVELFVSEPYHFNDESRSRVEQLCLDLRLSYEVSDRAHWNDQCKRVSFRPLD